MVVKLFGRKATVDSLNKEFQNLLDKGVFKFLSLSDANERTKKRRNYITLLTILSGQVQCVWRLREAERNVGSVWKLRGTVEKN